MECADKTSKESQEKSGTATGAIEEVLSGQFSAAVEHSDEPVEMTMGDIINGGGGFIGLNRLVQKYLDEMKCEADIRDRLDRCVALFSYCCIFVFPLLLC
jgi:hypothetical protein